MPTWVREPEPVGLGESVQFDIRPGGVPVTLTRVGRQDVCQGQNEAEQPRDSYRSDHLEETMFPWQITSTAEQLSTTSVLRITRSLLRYDHEPCSSRSIKTTLDFNKDAIRECGVGS